MLGRSNENIPHDAHGVEHRAQKREKEASHESAPQLWRKEETPDLRDNGKGHRAEKW